MLTIQKIRVEEKVIPLFPEDTLELHFPCGMLGFEESKSFKLRSIPDLHPFMWLEENQSDGLAFLVVPPPCVVESYQIELSDEDVGFLEINGPEDAVVLNVATFHPDGSITVNLKGPIVYNRHTFTARQVVPKNASILPIKHPLAN